MELGEHRQDEPPVPDCDCRRCAVATRDDLRKDAERYRWLRKHFRFTNESMRELWFDSALEPDDAGLPVDLDQGIDAAMKGANEKVRRPAEGA